MKPVVEIGQVVTLVAHVAATLRVIKLKDIGPEKIDIWEQKHITGKSM
jgi:hypothetical protein